MTYQCSLDYDEIVLLNETGVARGNTNATYTDELLLTNTKIIRLQKDRQGNLKTTYIYPLNQLKIYNGAPQAKIGKLTNGVDCLDLFFVDGYEEFTFQYNNRETIYKWIGEINKVFGIVVEDNSKLNFNHSEKDTSDNDSVIGAFKEVGNEFKKIGKGFISALGIHLNDNTTASQSNKTENMVTDYQYQLETDEIVILSQRGVGLSGDLTNIANSVLLTNKKIVVEYTTGIFDHHQHIDIFDLCDIKLYNGQLQIKSSKLYDEPVLELFFINSRIAFRFFNEGSKKKQISCIDNWINKIQSAYYAVIEGAKVYEIPTISCPNCKAKIEPGMIFCTSCGTPIKVDNSIKKTEDYICKQCGAPVPEGQNFCTECGTPIEKSNDTIIDKNNIPNAATSSVQKQDIPIEQQIELLQKLKSLVDVGILTQEEFEKKKKEIL